MSTAYGSMAVNAALTFNALRLANDERNEQTYGNRMDADKLAIKLSEETGEVSQAYLDACEAPEHEAGEAREHLMEELADVVIVADLLASELGISLEQAVRNKFNSRSAQKGSLVRI